MLLKKKQKKMKIKKLLQKTKLLKKKLLQKKNLLKKKQLKQKKKPKKKPCLKTTFKIFSLMRNISQKTSKLRRHNYLRQLLQPE